jgi:hypothetical protein
MTDINRSKSPNIKPCRHPGIGACAGRNADTQPAGGTGSTCVRAARLWKLDTRWRLQRAAKTIRVWGCPDSDRSCTLADALSPFPHAHTQPASSAHGPMAHAKHTMAGWQRHNDQAAGRQGGDEAVYPVQYGPCTLSLLTHLGHTPVVNKKSMHGSSIPSGANKGHGPRFKVVSTEPEDMNLGAIAKAT